MLIDYDNLCEDISHLSNLRNAEQSETESGCDTLIHRMVQQLHRQEGRTPRQFRYDDPVLERFALMAWILAGRRWYEVLNANFQGIFPCTRTIQSKLDAFESTSVEGHVNAKRLKDYLIQNDLPMVVSLSEDATGVIQQAQYSSKLNCLLGFSLPLGESGLPDAALSVVKTAADIVNIFNSLEKASVAMVVMAQPMSLYSPPIRLCCFGSNNKFTALDVQRRALTIEGLLKKEGVEVITYSADGDTRELKVMRSMIRLGAPSTGAGKNISFYLS